MCIRLRRKPDGAWSNSCNIFRRERSYRGAECLITNKVRKRIIGETVRFCIRSACLFTFVAGFLCRYVRECSKLGFITAILPTCNRSESQNQIARSDFGIVKQRTLIWVPNTVGHNPNRMKFICCKIILVYLSQMKGENICLIISER